ncbi:MAG: hypothetical protein IPL58_05715 [Betaproteobacteria bacterium]|uniref:Uncharacterized protein n=1 Tax=Candidatus Proximibacter danicus TaxID=2954365 RepID=A0A9D7PRF1_9PROT|nr:hypothetical protein [Candidatus Proximibacter danicus]
MTETVPLVQAVALAAGLGEWFALLAGAVPAAHRLVAAEAVALTACDDRADSGVLPLG